MGRKRSNKRKRSRASGKKKARHGPVFFKHPLSDLPPEKVRPGLIELAKASNVRFHESLDTVLKILRSVEPLQTITTLTTYGLFGTMTNEGKHTNLLKGTRFSQAHVELVQALSLTIPAADVPDRPPHASIIQQLFDLLPALG